MRVNKKGFLQSLVILTSGSLFGTLIIAVCEIAKKIQNEKIQITAIPTSYEIKMLCSYFNIPTVTLIEKKTDIKEYMKKLRENN